MNCLDFFWNYNLFPFVVTTMGTNPVRHFSFATIGTGNQSGSDCLPMSAPFIATGFGSFSFWNSHF